MLPLWRMSRMSRADSSENNEYASGLHAYGRKYHYHPHTKAGSKKIVDPRKMKSMTESIAQTTTSTTPCRLTISPPTWRTRSSGHDTPTSPFINLREVYQEENQPPSMVALYKHQVQGGFRLGRMQTGAI